MTDKITIKRGLDIPLQGAAGDAPKAASNVDRFAVTPDDFPGYVWKVVVKPGAGVKAGEPVMRAKENPDICLVAPVSGVVTDVKRGERRKILYIEIKAGNTDAETKFPVRTGNLEAILDTLCQAGLFALIRQRPFDIVPQLDTMPRDIFVTAFDTAPLSPAILRHDMIKWLEPGLKALSQLTKGKVYLGVKAGSGLTSEVAEVYEFDGPHPAGNVGVQINHIAPVNKGDAVWTLDAATACRIGKLFSDGILDLSATVAVTGPDVKNPVLLATVIGASIAELLKDNIKETGQDIRIISGNVLSGIKVDAKEGFLRYPYRQITVIDEGDHADEFMGWASLSPKKYSVKHTFPAFLRKGAKDFNFDARLLGGHRAMIVSGEYDKVFPFDIYPEYLIKAILAKNIDKMEQLGIYEVAPEDFALPEFVDTSKLPLQHIVREGLDYLRKETM